MTLYIIEPSQGFYTGTIAFENLDGSGQLSVYDQIVSDLAPTKVETEFDLTLGWRVVYRAIVRVGVQDYLYLNKYSGYPDRFNFGQLRWLRGQYADELYYIDTELWVQPKRHHCWVAANEERTPGFGDPFEPISGVLTTNLMYPLSQPDISGRLSPVQGNAVDYIAYYTNTEVVFNIAVTYVANSISINPVYGVPPDITLFQL